MSETVTSTPPSSPSPRRWPRLLRRLIGSVLLLGLALLLVLLAGIAWIAWHFNPQAQARQLAEQVEVRSGYLLSTAAPPRLTFTPRLGLTWGPLLLESPADDGPTGAATRRVATAQGMHLSLDALALLRGETRVRQVRIEGLSLWPAPDRRYALPAVDLSLSDSAASETLLPGTTTPPGRGMDPASTDPHLAPALTHALTLEATVLDAAGQALPLRLQGRIGVEAGASPLAGAAPVQRRAFHLLLQGSFDQTTFTLDATRTDASPVLRFDLALGTLDLDRYQARPLAQPALATASWQAGAAPDTTGLVGSWGSDLAGPGADASSDRMAAARPAVRTTGTGALLRWVHDLGLDSLDLQGAVRVASLQFMNVKLTHLRLQAQARDLPLQDSQGRKRRRIDFNPLTASLYEGGVHGTLRIHLDDDAPHSSRSSPATTFFATKLDLRDVRIGPLLRDALGVDWLEGRGNVALDLRSGGATPGTFTRHLNGSVGLQLRDGSIGLDVADVLRAGLGQLGKLNITRGAPAPVPQAGANSRWRTAFEGLRASFQIEDGVARNQDLNLQAPSLRVGGGGTAWLAENRLDYTLRVTIAPAGLQATPAEGATSLDSLRGLTVPVQLRGPFDDVQWRIAYADIAPTPQLRQRLRGWAQDTLGRLRGLLPPDNKPKD